MKNIIFIAPPAAGKGTQSSYLVNDYGYVHISTGNMLREAIASGSEFGKRVKNIIDKGGFVDDDTMVGLIDEKLKSIAGKPFILDGFPRTLNQAIELDKMLNDDYVVIYLDISKQKSVERILNRITCHKCGNSYNMIDEKLKPRILGICDSCGSELTKRDDDNGESLNVRFELFLKNNELILDYYKNLNCLKIVDVDRDPSLIYEDIVEIIND